MFPATGHQWSVEITAAVDWFETVIDPPGREFDKMDIIS